MSDYTASPSIRTLGTGDVKHMDSFLPMPHQVGRPRSTTSIGYSPATKVSPSVVHNPMVHGTTLHGTTRPRVVDGRPGSGFEWNDLQGGRPVGHDVYTTPAVRSRAAYGNQLSSVSASYGMSGMSGVVSGVERVGATYDGETRTVRGEERVISTREFVDESRTTVMGERFVEHSVKVPKKIMVEEIIEKIIVVPERRVREEIREDIEIVKEKIVEVSKPIIQERIIEVPEIHYVEKVTEMITIEQKEKIVEVPVVQIQERLVEVPRVHYNEKIVEVPEISYREVPYERIEEVPEIREEVVLKQIPVPQYVDVPVPEYVTVEDRVDIDRAFPVPIEAIITYEFKLPQFRPVWKKVEVPVYVPRFIEIPLPMDMMTQTSIREAEMYASQVSLIGVQDSVSLCALEEMAKAKYVDFQTFLHVDNVNDTILQAANSGHLPVQGTFTPATGKYYHEPTTMARGVPLTTAPVYHQPVRVGSSKMNYLDTGHAKPLVHLGVDPQTYAKKGRHPTSQTKRPKTKKRV